ncbi:hypothetical protein GO599_02660 [Sulfolobus islandicus]|uniref:Uncharacterized protein n=1 Tax=Saccharolobus islandicus (strain HVE10/4) TaxID=930943 RepID=F0NNW7_SACI0|nr:hypothetical protein [Sulfolobus islandicus]ADX82153.1 conserved hypothetical protein [Sulfolobus islandicus HVE10/4]WCM36521.1 hypothetical protein GO599_02660 [Sulfolobus islandicus]
MNLFDNYKIFTISNVIMGLVFSALYFITTGFIQYYNLVYGILTLGIAIWGIGRYYFKKIEDDKIRVGVQTSWLIVSFALGYISIIYAPVLFTRLDIIIIESILSIIQILWGSVLLAISYRKGYSVIKV